MKILIINGPNLNMTGSRQPEIYGHVTWEKFMDALEEKYRDSGVEISYFQSNSEGAIIDAIQQARDEEDFAGLVINPGAYAHYSLAIADALAGVDYSRIEVHISNIMARETERHRCVTAASCRSMICGLGLDGYIVAIDALRQMYKGGQPV